MAGQGPERPWGLSEEFSEVVVYEAALRGWFEAICLFRPSAREVNLVRLRRSFEKNDVSLKHFDAIRAGYEGKNFSPRSREGHEEEL